MDEVKVRADTVKPPVIIAVEDPRNLHNRLPDKNSEPTMVDDKENGTKTSVVRVLKRRLRGDQASESPDLDSEGTKRTGDNDATRYLTKRRFVEASKKIRSEQLENVRKAENAEKRKRNLEELSKAIRQNNSRRASLGRKEPPPFISRSVHLPRKSPLEAKKIIKAEIPPKRNSISISEIFRKPVSSQKKPKPAILTPKPENVFFHTDSKKYSPEEIKAYIELKKVKLAKQKRQERKQHEEMRRHRNDQIKLAEEFHKKGAVTYRRMIERKKKRSRASSISEPVDPDTALEGNRLEINLLEPESDFIPQKVLVTDVESDNVAGSTQDDHTMSSRSTHEEEQRSEEQQRVAERIRKMKESAGRLILRVTKYTQENVEKKSQSVVQPNIVSVAEGKSPNPMVEITSTTCIGPNSGRPSYDVTIAGAIYSAGTAAATGSDGGDGLFGNVVVKFPESARFGDNPFSEPDCYSIQSEGLSESISTNLTVMKVENNNTETECSTKMDWNIFGRPAPSYRPNPLSIVNIFATRYLERKEEIVLNGEPDNACLIPKPPAESRSSIGAFSRSPKLRIISASTYPGSPPVQELITPIISVNSHDAISTRDVEKATSHNCSTEQNADSRADRFSEPEYFSAENSCHDSESADEQEHCEEASSGSYSSDQSEGFEEEGIQNPRLSPRSLALEAKAELRHFEEMSKAAVELCELECSYASQSLREATAQAQQDLTRFVNDASAVKTQLELHHACNQEIQNVGQVHIQQLEALTTSVLNSVLSHSNTNRSGTNSMPEDQCVPQPLPAVVQQNVKSRLYTEEMDSNKLEDVITESVKAKETFFLKLENDMASENSAFGGTTIARLDKDKKDCLIRLDIREPSGNELTSSKSVATSNVQSLQENTESDSSSISEPPSASTHEFQQIATSNRRPHLEAKEVVGTDFVDSKYSVSSQTQNSLQNTLSSINKFHESASASEIHQTVASDNDRSNLSLSGSVTVDNDIRTDSLVPTAESADILSSYISCETDRSDSGKVSSLYDIKSYGTVSNEVEHADADAERCKIRDELEVNGFPGLTNTYECSEITSGAQTTNSSGSDYDTIHNVVVCRKGQQLHSVQADAANNESEPAGFSSFSEHDSLEDFRDDYIEAVEPIIPDKDLPLELNQTDGMSKESELTKFSLPSENNWPIESKDYPLVAPDKEPTFLLKQADAISDESQPSGFSSFSDNDSFVESRNSPGNVAEPASDKISLEPHQAIAENRESEAVESFSFPEDDSYQGSDHGSDVNAEVKYLPGPEPVGKEQIMSSEENLITPRSHPADYITKTILNDLVAELQDSEPNASRSQSEKISSGPEAEIENSDDSCSEGCLFSVKSNYAGSPNEVKANEAYSHSNLNEQVARQVGPEDPSLVKRETMLGRVDESRADCLLQLKMKNDRRSEFIDSKDSTSKVHNLQEDVLSVKSGIYENTSEDTANTPKGQTPDSDSSNISPRGSTDIVNEGHVNTTPIVIESDDILSSYISCETNNSDSENDSSPYGAHYSYDTEPNETENACFDAECNEVRNESGVHDSVTNAISDKEVPLDHLQADTARSESGPVDSSSNAHHLAIPGKRTISDFLQADDANCDSETSYYSSFAETDSFDESRDFNEKPTWYSKSKNESQYRSDPEVGINIQVDDSEQIKTILPTDAADYITRAILTDLVSELADHEPNVSQLASDRTTEIANASSTGIVAEMQQPEQKSSQQESNRADTITDAILGNLVAELEDSKPTVCEPESDRADAITNAILGDLVVELQNSVDKNQCLVQVQSLVFDASNPEYAKFYIAEVLQAQRSIDWENPILSEDIFEAIENHRESQDSASSFRRFIFDMLQSVILSLRPFGGELPPESWHKMKPKRLMDHFWKEPCNNDIMQEVLYRLYPDPSTTYDNVDEIVNFQVQKEEWYYDEHIADVQFEIADLIFNEILQNSIQAMVQ